MTLPQPPAPTTTCYRHPDREGGRHCTRCGKSCCSQCLVQADVGSMCVDCARAGRPDVRTRARYWSAGQATLVTYTLIAVNVAVFAWIVAANRDALGLNYITQQQVDIGLARPLVERDGWYRLVTSGFLHFGFIHLAFNMLLLFQLGQLLEPALGRVRFGLLYGAALLGGSAGALLLETGNPPPLTGGASGAVFGLLGAAAVVLWRRGVNPLSTGIGAVLLVNLVITFSIRNISVGGHVGGLVAGAIIGWFVTAAPGRPVQRWTTYAAPVAVAVAAVGLSYYAVKV